MKVYAPIGIMLLGFAINANANDLGINVVLEGEIKPGVYGRVELNKNSHPALVYADPHIVVVDEHHHHKDPVYLHVPPGHAKDWAKHCHKYNACSRSVYFVKSEEYKKKHKKHKESKQDKKHKHH